LSGDFAACDLPRAMTLLTTRLLPPRRERGVVARDIVPVVLDQMQGKRLTVARAPAGYGKSLLLGQLHDQLRESGQAVGWVSTAELDGSAHELALYCAAALHSALPPRPLDIEWLMSSLGEVSTENLGMALCNTMQRIGHAFTLFFDDVHELDGSAAMHLLAGLVRDAPNDIRFIVATRTQPAFNLARLRAHGDLLELGIEELRFSISETGRFLSADDASPASSDLVALAHQRSEGWPAGLQLISLSGGHELTQRLQTFSGSDRGLADYLQDDVLAALPENVQAFLLHTSVLRQFTAELCDDILQRCDSRDVITGLERTGLFIFSLDTTGEWFRYHHLFGEFLEKRLQDRDPSLRKALHATAARSFRRRKMASEALYHSCMADDLEHAAAVLDDACEESFYQGRLWSLAGWMRKVPESLLDAYPRMQLARVWSLTLELDFEQASGILARVSQRIDDLVARKALDMQRASDLDRLVLHRRMMLAQFKDDLPETERLCNKLLIDFPNDDEPFLRGSLDASLANAHREQYKLDSLERLDKSAREYFGRTGMSYPFVFHESLIGSSYAQSGRAGHAARCFKSGIDIAGSIAGVHSSLTAMPALLLAQLQLERCEFALAKAAFDQFLPLAGKVGFVDHVIAGYVGRARLADLDEDHGLAQELLVRAMELGAAGGFERLRWHAVAEQIRQLIHRKDIQGAERLASKVRLPKAVSELAPTDGVTSKDEAVAMAWMRLATATGSASQSEELGRRWADFAERRGCVRTEIRMRVATVAARLAVGDAKAAVRSLIDTVALAAPSGYALFFVEECEALRSAVAKVVGIEFDGLRTKEFAKSLAFSLARKPDRAQLLTVPEAETAYAGFAAVEPCQLSQREIDILSQVASGSLNKEIGDRLGLTEGSVKWYLQQIYGKLGTHRRVEAVRKARALGLMR